MKKLNLKNKKVAIAMSGGVDSGLAAALLVKAGCQCAGFHMKLWHEPQFHLRGVPQAQHHPGGVSGSFENKCCSTESLEAARKTAHQLGMPFYVVDFSQLFKKKVVVDFLKAYGSGLTPNPCILCNKFIKFGELLDYVRKLGFDYLATGHYARIILNSSDGNFDSVSDSLAKKHALLNGGHRRSQGETSQNLSGSLRYSLLAGEDKNKDQSYFLYNLTQNQLSHILFPVGEYQKKEVITMAKKWQLPVAYRPESQEICFLPENDYRPFLKRHIANKIKPGEIVDLKGNLIGRHQGLPLYTIGQRRGFFIRTKNIEHRIPRSGIPLRGTKGIIPPYYIIKKDVKKNQLIVGFGQETEKKEFMVKDLNWIDPNYPLFVRIRHQGRLLEAKVENLGTKVKVILNEPERGIAPGQSAVFFYKNEVLGGGIISI